MAAKPRKKAARKKPAKKIVKKAAKKETKNPKIKPVIKLDRMEIKEFRDYGLYGKEPKWMVELVDKWCNSRGSTVSVDLTKLKDAEIEFIRNSYFVDGESKDLIIRYSLFGESMGGDPFKCKVSSVEKLQDLLVYIDEHQKEIFGYEGAYMAMELNSRFYPSRVEYNITGGFFSPPAVRVTGNFSILGFNLTKYCNLNIGLLYDRKGNVLEKTIQEVLESTDLRFLQDLDYTIEDHKEVCSLANIMQYKPGLCVDASGPALLVAPTRNFFGVVSLEMDEVDFATSVHKESCVVEPDLESDIPRKMGVGGNRDQTTPLPVVRIFSLATKRYLFVDVRDLKEHGFNDGYIDGLILPTETKELIMSAIKHYDSAAIGDIIVGKHGGLIILVRGSTGVGKTLTAEVISEYVGRPLYTISIGEIGVDLETVEDNLEVIFKRASRWNAILLLDEADIFLTKRDDNMERSAIVGVFLRLVDYFKGILFLTTNRENVIDPAFLSRTTLNIEYPKLDLATRKKIWTNMLANAGISVTTRSLVKVSKHKLNGREIRNIVRLMAVQNAKELSTAEVDKIVRQNKRQG